MEERFINFNDICAWRHKLVEQFEKSIGEVEEIIDIESIPLSDLWEKFPFPEYKVIEYTEDEKGNPLEDGVIRTETEINEDVLLPNKDLFLAFLNDEISTIIGGANESINGVFYNVNNLIQEGNTITVYSTFTGKARSAALMFLGSRLYTGNVKFISSIDELKKGDIMSRDRLKNL